MGVSLEARASGSSAGGAPKKRESANPSAKRASKAKTAPAVAVVEGDCSQVGPERMRELVMDIFGEQEHSSAPRPSQSGHLVRGHPPRTMPARSLAQGGNHGTTADSESQREELALPRLGTGSMSAR